MHEALSYAARRAVKVGIVGALLILAVPVVLGVFNALSRLP